MRILNISDFQNGHELLARLVEQARSAGHRVIEIQDIDSSDGTVDTLSDAVEDDLDTVVFIWNVWRGSGDGYPPDALIGSTLKALIMNDPTNLRGLGDIDQVILVLSPASLEDLPGVDPTDVNVWKFS